MQNKINESIEDLVDWFIFGWMKWVVKIWKTDGDRSFLENTDFMANFFLGNFSSHSVRKNCVLIIFLNFIQMFRMVPKFTSSSNATDANHIFVVHLLKIGHYLVSLQVMNEIIFSRVHHVRACAKNVLEKNDN